MSRNDTLVDIGWAEKHLGDNNTVFVEVDDNTACEGVRTAEAVRPDGKTEPQDLVERGFVDQPGYAKLLGQDGIAGDDFDCQLGTDLVSERPGQWKEAA